MAPFPYRSYRQQEWIAVYILLIIWAVLELFAIGMGYLGNRIGTTTPAVAGDGGAAVDSGGGAGGGAYSKHPQQWRGGKAARVARYSFIMAFAATTANELGHGITRAVSILIWAFFALSIVYIFTSAGARHPVLPAAIGIPQIIIVLVAFGLAFRY
ncbi:hypothetical protein HKX48_001506 [Thoreauomyces humboldtii]|nr:hypothetical protein HKX48_001506 [Thoreauomyces humboldtii]